MTKMGAKGLEHYLDNSATTAVSKAAADRAYQVMTQTFGNPSSLHAKGMDAEHELTAARKAVAAQLRVPCEELTFTSGGTEANNLALFGAAYANARVRRKIIVSAVEHSSVLESAKRLEDEGFSVARIMPRADGAVHPEDVAAETDADTALVSVMLVNNETGAVMPVREIFAAVRAVNSQTLCHTDAVQAFGKLEIKARSLGADLLSVSGHKVHAPKGVGALYVRRGVRLTPRQYGGEQEKRLRPGTENLPAIAAFGVACGEFDIAGNFKRVAALNAYARERLLQIDGVRINSPDGSLPYVLNISAGRVRSESMLHFLEEREVFVSSGSACAKGKPSHVLSALGLSREQADSALRISFCKTNTEADIDALCEGIALGLRVLAHR